MKTSTSAMEVVEYLQWLASNELADDESSPLTNLMVQKLLYFVQGWSLAETGQPLFRESIEAWDYGPVVKDAYQELKVFGKAALPLMPRLRTTLTEHEQELIRGVWDRYKNYSAYGLMHLSHRERPWREAAKGKTIPHEAMKQSFLEQMRQAEARLAAAWDRIDSAARTNTQQMFGREAI